MKRPFKKLLILTLLTSCASTSGNTLHEMDRAEAPQWKMIRLVGLDNHLRQIYETGLVSLDSKVNVGDVDYEEFSKTGGFLMIHGRTAFQTDIDVHVNFRSCNAIMGHFEYVDGKLKYRNRGQSAISCERVVKDREGALIVLATPMLVDDYFIELLPKITNYKVSEDGQTLSLLGEHDGVLGVFGRQEKSS